MHPFLNQNDFKNTTYLNVCKSLIYQDFSKSYYVDITGVILTPGEEGKNCLGNGEHYDDNRKLIECCCDECDYYCCCLPKHHKWYMPYSE